MITEIWASIFYDSSNDCAGRRVEYSLQGENICNSRGSEETVDTVPPGHFQVLRVTSELVVTSPAFRC